MKKNGLVYAMIFILVLSVSGHSLKTKVLIDFNVFEALLAMTYTNSTGEVISNSTVSNVDGVPRISIGYKDYIMTNWRVELNSSAKQVSNIINSYAQPVKLEGDTNVFGVRIHFPRWQNNSYAIIRPKYNIKVFGRDGRFQNVTNGVIPNVADIKSLSVSVYGLNFNYNLAIRIRNRENVMQEFTMGNLQFKGWRTLTWVNPNYVDRMDKREIKKVALYPRKMPFIVFDSFVVYRPSTEIGGNFVTYFRDVKMTYNPFNIDYEKDDPTKGIELTIDNEKVWGIIKAEGEKIQAHEERLLAEEIMLFNQEMDRLTN